MHIVIPMSGLGSRFVAAGYRDPKPLIVIDGKPIIEHVCDLYPGETKFTFICNAKHLAETDMRNVLKRIRPGGTIVEIPNHKKGPVFAVDFVRDLIDDEEEVIVSYCDFGTYWDYEDFLRHTRERNADGAVPAYRGFHPHMLGSTNYAFMRHDKQWMLEIKEKEPFTDNRMNEFASNGTYYFKKGSYVKKYFKELMDLDINVNGEYYVSLVYNLLVRDGLKVSIYEIQHMLQWGTPQDAEEYMRWSAYFRSAAETKEKSDPAKNSVTLIPLAGRGSRFAVKGYRDPKPLIPVSGKPMIVQAAHSLPRTERYVFVTLSEHLEKYPLQEALLEEFPQCSIVTVNEVTEGQAVTCSIGLSHVDPESSLLIAATDNGMLYSEKKWKELTESPGTDAVIFTFRGHVSAAKNPQMYGWVKTEGDDAVSVSVKVPVSDQPSQDHAITGTFWFRRAEIFSRGFESLLKKNLRVNNEFYVDSLMGELIEMGYKVKVMETDHYIGWGTPDDYETFVYWQSFFHKCKWHPYSLEKDITVKKSEIKNLDKKYRTFAQEYR